MQFIKDSVKQGSFVDETKYLDIGEFSDVAKYWSAYFQETGKKAFDGWKVEVSVSLSKEPGFKRLLDAGRGSIGPGGFTLVERQRFKQLTKKEDKEYVDSTFLIEYLLSLGNKKRSEYVLQ